jgi:hypothetical protein
MTRWPRQRTNGSESFWAVAATLPKSVETTPSGNRVRASASDPELTRGAPVDCHAERNEFSGQSAGSDHAEDCYHWRKETTAELVTDFAARGVNLLVRQNLAKRVHLRPMNSRASGI